ncbi:MAG: signal transduction protein [Pseudomonadota bacterium]
MKSALLLSASIILGLANTSLAQTPCPTAGCELAETIFGSIEDNPDGNVDLGEFVAFGKTVFTSMDTDENASISFAEYGEWDPGFEVLAEEAGREDEFETAKKILFAFWDRDGSKTISQQEFHQAMTVDFRRADIDQNAFLTRDEFLLGYIVNVAYRSALTGE